MLINKFFLEFCFDSMEFTDCKFAPGSLAELPLHKVTEIKIFRYFFYVESGCGTSLHHTDPEILMSVFSLGLFSIAV